MAPQAPSGSSDPQADAAIAAAWGNGGAMGTATTAGSYATQAQGDWMVYLGKPGHSDRGPAMHADSPDTKGSKFGEGPWHGVVPTDQAVQFFYSWPDSRMKAWGKTLEAAGLVKPGAWGYQDLEQWWQMAVEKAGNIKTLGGRNITPEQWVKTYASGQGLGGSSSASKAKTVKQTSTSTNYTDPDTAKALAQDMLTNLLGRRADDSEVQDYISSLHSYEGKNPSLTTTTTHTDAAGDATSQNVVSTGGVTAEGAREALRSKVTAKPEYGAYQAAATYFPLLQQALGATANVQGR